MHAGVMDQAATLKALRVLADPVRFQALQFLLKPSRSSCSQDDGVCGCDFEPVLGLAQPTVSHHMKQLVEVGLVRAEKRGRWTYYELQPAAFRALCAALAPFTGAPEPSKAKAAA
jgi:ArsR family transcriptional regulator, arsenate/arsenite/antimonite-responsive transcriptional repressor